MNLEAEHRRLSPVTCGPFPSRREWLGIGFVLLLFIAIRLPLFRGDALLLGWNSDGGIFGLMSRRVHDGVRFPIFFLGQSYMGAMTSYVAAAIGFLTGDANPLALRLAAALECFLATLLYWLGLRRAFDRGTALMVAAWLAAGPWFLFHFTVAPIGAEQAWFFGAVLFAFVTLSPLQRTVEWVLFGFLFGFMWWQNQSAVFVPAAALVVIALESEWWRRVRRHLTVDRLLMRNAPVLVQGTGWLLVFLTLLGLLYSFGLRVPALFLYSPVAEPLTLLIIFHAILFGRAWRDARPPGVFVFRAPAFTIGFVVAYLPVIVGGIRGVYPKSYGLSVPAMTLDRIPRQIWTIVRSDFWMFVGGVVAGVMILALILAGLRNAQNQNRATRIALWTIILAAAFYVFSSRAHPGTVRYVVVALPCVYAYAARAGSKSRLAAAGVLVVLVALVFGRGIDTRAVVAGQREAYATLPGNFDPRPTLAAIERDGYTVCDADYWIAYKLQWLSDERVRFIVSHGYNRTREEVRGLTSQCHVDEKGNVIPAAAGGSPQRRGDPQRSQSF